MVTKANAYFNTRIVHSIWGWIPFFLSFTLWQACKYNHIKNGWSRRITDQGQRDNISWQPIDVFAFTCTNLLWFVLSTINSFLIIPLCIIVYKWNDSDNTFQVQIYQRNIIIPWSSLLLSLILILPFFFSFLVNFLIHKNSLYSKFSVFLLLI